MAGFDFLRLVLVAAVAGIFHIIGWVAGLAVGGWVILLNAVADRESMLAQAGGRPGLGSVAVLALQAESTGVDLRFSVTLGTFSGRAPKTRASCFVCVAALALYLGVLAVQHKDLFMRKAAQTIYSVMAVQTGRAKLGLVIEHERRVSLCVTVDAALHASSLATTFAVARLAA